MYMLKIVINVLEICASSWSLAKVILRRTVSETSNFLQATYILMFVFKLKFPLVTQMQNTNMENEKHFNLRPTQL